MIDHQLDILKMIVIIAVEEGLDQKKGINRDTERAGEILTEKGIGKGGGIGPKKGLGTSREKGIETDRVKDIEREHQIKDVIKILTDTKNLIQITIAIDDSPTYSGSSLLIM